MAEKKSQDAGAALNGELWRISDEQKSMWTSCDAEMACLVWEITIRMHKNDCFKWNSKYEKYYISIYNYTLHSISYFL